MGREHYTAREQGFYRAYINSPAWKRRKTARIHKAGGQCEFVTTRYEPGVPRECRCPRRRYLTVHHNNYKNLGAEPDADLDVFCYLHHMVEHLLLMRKCNVCGSPCLLYDAMAELWVSATLATMGINLDWGPVNWRNLPTKEQLAQQIDPRCLSCRGLGDMIVKPGDE